MSSSSVRVASVPAAHPYVAAVTADPRVELLADPRPPGAAPGVWWPPVVLDADWLRSHADDFDVLHVHFGTESLSLDRLTDAFDAARRLDRPVVVTVHDLRHPQLGEHSPEQRAFARQLDAMLPRADALLTLTAGAAAEIAARWGRTAEVLPHPSLLSAGRPDDDPSGAEWRTRQEPRPRPGADSVIGLALKDLRPNIDAVGATRRLLDAVPALADAGLPARAEIRMHGRVRDEAARAEVRALCSGRADVDLVEHERLDDAALERGLSALDAAVLPYSHGTHSGWLELCWDLGVPVAVPTTGFFPEQHDDETVRAFDPAVDGDLARALVALLGPERADDPSARGFRRTALRAERRDRRRRTDAAVARAHAELYLHLARKAS